jgi:hypothetical protein
VLLFVVRPIAVLLSTAGSALTARERAFAATFAPRGIVALSVATVASAELARMVGTAGTGPPSGEALGLLADAQRLELIGFIVIAGSVLLGSTFSPLWARVLNVRAGAGTSVLLVGGHPLSVELAKRLKRHAVPVRIIDSNDARVADAAGAGLDAVPGDATDARWMDDIGNPHGTGWVIAWTGNDVVDLIVLRWAHERVGPRRAVVWSSEAVREPLAAADISRGEPITEWLDRHGDRRVELAESGSPAELARVLGWAVNGQFTLNFPGSRPLEAGVVFIGLRVVADGSRAVGVAAPAAALRRTA